MLYNLSTVGSVAAFLPNEAYDGHSFADALPPLVHNMDGVIFWEPKT